MVDQYPSTKMWLATLGTKRLYFDLEWEVVFVEVHSTQKGVMDEDCLNRRI